LRYDFGLSKRTDRSSAKNSADKNPGFDAKQNSIAIVRKPRLWRAGISGVAVNRFADPVKLQIDFLSRCNCRRALRLFAADHSDGSKISGGSGVNDDAVNAAIPERLTTQIKQGRVQIEKIGKAKLAGLCATRAALAFCPRADDTIICKSEVRPSFLGSIALCLPGFDWSQRFRIGERMIIYVQFP
jgi:hypothetical protein